MSKAKILTAVLLSLGAVGIAQAANGNNGNGNGGCGHGQTTNGCGGGSTTSAPEIDPASASTALTLLMGGLAVVRGRRRTQG